jgi:hypothetical protein
MAGRVNAPHWEKQGNAAWVACPGCARWFPVDPKLLGERRVALVCPGCAQSFFSTEAARVASSALSSAM